MYGGDSRVKKVKIPKVRPRRVGRVRMPVPRPRGVRMPYDAGRRPLPQQGRMSLPYLRLKELKEMEKALREFQKQINPAKLFIPQNPLLGRSLQGTIGGLKGVRGLPPL
jgi:hypothetical protein